MSENTTPDLKLKGYITHSWLTL